MTLPPSPCGTLREVSRTSPAFSLKMARISFSSAVSSVSPFGVTLPDQQVARHHLGADAHDAALVEVLEGLLGAVRDVAGDLLGAQLGGAGVDLVGLDVDRRQQVVLHQALRDDDRVLEVVALPAHEGDEHVAAQRQLAVVGRAAVGEHVARLHRLALADDRLLVDEGALVRARELVQLVVLELALGVLDDHVVGVDRRHRAAGAADDDVAGVHRRAPLDAGAHERGLGDHERDGLRCMLAPISARLASSCSRNGMRAVRHRDDLLRRDVHVLDVGGVGEDRLAALAAQDRADEAVLRVQLGVRLGDRLVLLLRGVEALDLGRHHAVHHAPVRRLDEPELVQGRVAAQRADQADVRALRGLDRAHAPVVGLVDVAHLDGGALAGEAAGAERRQAAPVREARPASWSGP